MIVPATVDVVGFFGTPLSVTVAVDVFLLLQTIVTDPLVFVVPPPSSDEQLLGTPNVNLVANVPPVTPPPTQPPSLPPLVVTTGFVFVVLPTFGNAGANAAVPVSVLQVAKRTC